MKKTPELDAKSDDSELSLEDSASGLEVVILTVSSARGTQAGALLLSAVPQPEACHQRAQNRRHWGERGPG